MRRDRGDLPLVAEINVTSLVDVAFTILLIFMITAPILQGGVEVGLPRADVEPLTASDDPFFVTILRDGTIVLEETEVDLATFRSSVSQLFEADAPGRVYIRADSAAPWGPILNVAAELRRLEVEMAFVGEPWSSRR